MTTVLWGPSVQVISHTSKAIDDEPQPQYVIMAHTPSLAHNDSALLKRDDEVIAHTGVA